MIEDFFNVDKAVTVYTSYNDPSVETSPSPGFVALGGDSFPME